jgi:hypothetical protein
VSVEVLHDILLILARASGIQIFPCKINMPRASVGAYGHLHLDFVDTRGG